MSAGDKLSRARALARQLGALSIEAARDFPRCRANLWLELAAEAAAKAARHLEPQAAAEDARRLAQIQREARP